MQIVGCGKGHFYNPELYSSCPYCAQETKGREPLAEVDEPVPVVFPSIHVKPVEEPQPVPQSVTVEAPKNVDEPIPVVFPGSYVTPVEEPQPVPQSVTEEEPKDVGEPTPVVFPSSNVTAVVEPQPVPQSVIVEEDPNEDFDPVVGWLVCIDGPAKGRDYRIHSQNNYIGRAKNMDICLESDSAVGFEHAAVLVYDDLEKIFYFGPDKGRNIVRLNKRAAVNVVEIKAMDQLTIGKSTFVFVPLCGEGFDWNALPV